MAHFVTDEELEEIDRNARAYGFEVGRGHPLRLHVVSTSEDNPFMDKEWRSKIHTTEGS